MTSDKNNKKAKIFVLGNEKGGVGKTTCSIHIITSLLDYGYKVASIDVDHRQGSLSAYIANRQRYNELNPEKQVCMPAHMHIKSLKLNDDIEAQDILIEDFKTNLNKYLYNVDYIVIDTPGSFTKLNQSVHSYADVVITPINDSFLDLDVIAKLRPENLNMSTASIYSEMLWNQRMERTMRDNSSIEWLVVRNRLSNLYAHNKQKMYETLEKLSKRIAFRVVPGFSERVIYRELFNDGLTLVDIMKVNLGKSLNVSHIAARQELRNFLDALDIKQVDYIKDKRA